ncbi:hypothetical protein ACHAXA_006024 [Cyclostephanos tholiformis]|uniref:protein-disulfide reductase n=1 Tax=Cyclostephanos tholiformis TaxID=382380 RepID=A0ABD3SQQ9_9STRA
MAAPASWTTELFGPKVLTKPNTTGVPTSSAFGGKKLVALYFSASWCPPCKRFTPILIDFYEACKDELEIVFISSDRDDRSFGDYFAKMPWLAMIPAYMNSEQNARQRKMADAFKIQGIPTLVVLDAKTGHFVVANGRDAVMQVSSDESRRALFLSWLSKESVPLSQAIFGDEDTGGLLWKALTYVAKRPQFILAVFYLVRRFLRQMATLGKEKISDETEL